MSTLPIQAIRYICCGAPLALLALGVMMMLIAIRNAPLEGLTE